MLAVLQALRQENEYDLTIDKQDCVNFMLHLARVLKFAHRCQINDGGDEISLFFGAAWYVSAQ